MAQLTSHSREDIKSWYVNWLTNRTGLDSTDITEDSDFVEGLSMDSGDLKALRAALKNEYGRVVDDEEAKKNTTVGLAIDATCRLVND